MDNQGFQSDIPTENQESLSDIQTEKRECKSDIQSGNHGNKRDISLGYQGTQSDIVERIGGGLKSDIPPEIDQECDSDVLSENLRSERSCILSEKRSLTSNSPTENQEKECNILKEHSKSHSDIVKQNRGFKSDILSDTRDSDGITPLEHIETDSDVHRVSAAKGISDNYEIKSESEVESDVSPSNQTESERFLEAQNKEKPSITDKCKVSNLVAIPTVKPHGEIDKEEPYANISGETEHIVDICVYKNNDDKGSEGPTVSRYQTEGEDKTRDGTKEITLDPAILIKVEENDGQAVKLIHVTQTSIDSPDIAVNPNTPNNVVNQGQAESEIGRSLLEKPQTNGQPKVLIERSLFSQKHFDENFEAVSRPSPTVRQIIGKKLSKCRCSGLCLKKFLYAVFPFINIMKNYNIREDITGDIVSGLTVGIMHIPQGMAYGMLTTLPPVYGLYMSFFPVLLYFFFGSSKHVSMGTFAVACLMIGSAVSKGMDSVAGSWSVAETVSSLSENMTAVNVTGNYTGNENETTTTTSVGPGDDTSSMSPEELDLRLQFAMSVTFMVGVIQLIMGLFRLGFITVYLSDPLISGFTTGAACHVFTSQIKHVFGVKTARYSGVFKLVYTYRDFFTNIEMTNIVTLLMSVVCIAALYCTSRFINQNPKLKPKMFMPVPIELIVVVLGTVVSYALNLENTHDVIVVSDIPTGLPVPNTKCLTRISSVISDAIALAIVIFAISISMGKLLAKKHDYEVDANQELMAYGISTVVSSFLSSAAPSASLSRSLVQERVGGRTQVAGLVSCCLLLVVLLAIGPYFRTLPNAVLASIIIVALRGMFLQVLDLKKLWRVSLIDFFVWIVAFLATVLLDVDLGLGAAVVFNLITVVCRSQRPYACLLGQIPGTDIYRDMNVYQEAQEVPGVKIFRFEHSLFFVNTEQFRTLLYKSTANPRTLKIAQKKREAKLAKMNKNKKDDLVIVGDNVPDVSIPVDTFDMEIDSSGLVLKGTDSIKAKSPLDLDFHTIILDCSPWSFVDSMAVKVLTSAVGEYKAVGVKVILANCKAGIREMFQKTKFYDTLDHSNIYVSLHDAVLQALHPELTVPMVQPESSEVGTSVADREDSVTDYNIDFIDNESIQGRAKQGSMASSKA